VSAVDERSGNTYYYHPTTGNTSWTPPHMAPPPPPLHAAHQPAPVAHGQPAQTFEASNFNRLYSAAKPPEFQDEVMRDLRALLRAFAEDQHLPQHLADDFFHSLQLEAFKDKDQMLGDLPAACQRLWTSAKPLCPQRPQEFCSILNAALRSDQPTLIDPASRLVRGINLLCVTRRMDDLARRSFPREGRCFRGGGFDDQFKPFFTAGKEYRVPGFLATSFNQDKASEFLYRAVQHAGKSGVLWIVQVDPRGKEQFQFKCKHVNLIAFSNVPGEEEYLFAPYSAFRIDRVEWSPTPDDRTPHRIYLTAYLDNRDAPPNLPLAPWY